MKLMNLFPFVSLLAPAVAFAQPQSPESPDGFDHEVPAVQSGLEVGVATGYMQSGGKLGGNLGSLEDVSGPGEAVELDVGYRILPELSVGVYGTFSNYKRGDRVASSTDVLGATGGIQAAWHIRPDRSVDPWVSLGTGWKALWLNPVRGKVTSLQGLELARLQVGVDYRLSRDLAIAPVIGGSVNTFLSQDSMMTSDRTEISDKKVSFTGFAGISGRFDFGSTR